MPDLNTEFIPIDNLLLDKENPRLASILKDEEYTQSELLKIIFQEMDVKELIQSISYNGYLPYEPIVVMPDVDNGNHVVLEGNRRVAACKIINSRENQDLVNYRNITFPEGKQEEILQSVHELPVTIVTNREDVWQFLGFKHIKGPRRWDSLEKARYCYQLVNDYGMNVEQIVLHIGDRHETVKRLLYGYFALLQAEEHGFEQSEIDDRKLPISHLYTALSRADYQEYLALEREPEPNPNPIPEASIDKFIELMKWLFGCQADGIRKVIKSQNPDLRRLGVVINHRRALETLRRKKDLDNAFEQTQSHIVRLQEYLNAGIEALERANGVVAVGYNGEEGLLDEAEEIWHLSMNLLKQMQRIKKGDDVEKPAM